MLNRMEVTEPPNSAPQYMLERRMTAETGAIPNVKGRSSETPFGAPSPGRTPTRMPKSTPMSISPRCGSVTAMVKPCRRSSRFSMARSEAEHVRKGAVRQRHLEHALEYQIERERRRNRDRDGHRQRAPALQQQNCEHVCAGRH